MVYWYLLLMHNNSKCHQNNDNQCSVGVDGEGRASVAKIIGGLEHIIVSVEWHEWHDVVNYYTRYKLYSLGRYIIQNVIYSTDRCKKAGLVCCIVLNILFQRRYIRRLPPLSEAV